MSNNDQNFEVRQLSLVADLPSTADSASLAVAEERLHTTALRLAESRADLYLRDRLQEEAWTVLTEWAASRSIADAGLPFEQVGRWTLSTRERLWLDAGLLDPRLVRELPGSAGLSQALATLFEPTSAGVQLVPLSVYFLERYRGLLRLTERVEEDVAWANCDRQLRATRSQIERLLIERAELLAKVVSDTVPGAVQALDQLLPHLARITCLNREGGSRDPRSRRAQMKAVARARRLTHTVLQGIPVYRHRKRFETLQAELLKLRIDVLTAESQTRELSASRATPLGPAESSVDAEECREAAVKAVASVQRLLRTVSRTPTFCLPPFVLEHMPRVSAEVINGKLGKICALCPRIEHAIDKRWYPDMRVLLLPGVGHPLFSPETREILTPLFPLESNLHALTGVMGEAIFRADENLAESYSHFRRGETPDERGLLEAFHRDFVAWVENDGRGRNANERKTQRWFRENLVERALRARSNSR
ncbi:MAG: hypothetical protein AB7O52_06575 [Planctomycetota bacterium]